jgi:hypothetical protein
VTAARARALIPATVFRAGWSSSAFLFYAGTLVMLISILILLSSQNGEGDDFGLFGWSSLGLAAIVAAAGALRNAGLDLLAGLAAFIGLVVFAVWLGAFEDWIGLFPDDRDRFFSEDFEGGLFVIEALVVAAGLGALRLFRFPLLVLPIAAVFWYAVVDNVAVIVRDKPGEDTYAALSIVAGLLLVAAGIVLDRSDRGSYALWPHVAGGLAVGGGVLELLDHGNWRWALAGLISLVFVAAARVLARSSYAVIGALGILIVGAHFIEKWFSVPPPFPFLFFYGFDEDGSSDTWKGPFGYMVLGLVLVALGFLLERLPRRAARPIGRPSSAP